MLSCAIVVCVCVMLLRVTTACVCVCVVVVVCVCVRRSSYKERKVPVLECLTFVKYITAQKTRIQWHRYIQINI